MFCLKYFFNNCIDGLHKRFKRSNNAGDESEILLRNRHSEVSKLTATINKIRNTPNCLELDQESKAPCVVPKITKYFKADNGAKHSKATEVESKAPCAVPKITKYFKADNGEKHSKAVEVDFRKVPKQTDSGLISPLRVKTSETAWPIESKRVIKKRANPLNADLINFNRADLKHIPKAPRLEIQPKIDRKELIIPNAPLLEIQRIVPNAPRLEIQPTNIVIQPKVDRIEKIHDEIHPVNTIIPIQIIRVESDSEANNTKDAEKAKLIEIKISRIESDQKKVEDVTDVKDFVLSSDLLNKIKQHVPKYAYSSVVMDYRLSDTLLGKGGFGQVFEAMHTLTGRRVAMKITDYDAEIKLSTEADCLQMIYHPNVIRAFEAIKCSDPNKYYLVTELCEGPIINQLIPLSEDGVRPLLRQIIPAVDYLHGIGILHRDIKLGNILMDRHRNIKIIDFNTSTNEGPMNTIYGTEWHMAPEMMKRQPYGPPVDVWSIGVITYEMLMEKRNFPYPFGCNREYGDNYMFKMFKLNQMNPMPTGLSLVGEDFIKKFLRIKAADRITLKEAMEHPWLNKVNDKPFPVPNERNKVSPNIMKFMIESFGFKKRDILLRVRSNHPSPELATYMLLLKTCVDRERRKESAKPRSVQSESEVVAGQ